MSEHPGTPTSTRPAGHDGDAQSVTVVVPTKNAARTLAACLQSLRAQTYPCHIVVVDNNSTDSTLEIAEQMADLVLHWGPERSAQRNYGARSSPAGVVGFIDADMVLEQTVVEEAVAALSNGAGSVIVPERTVGSGFWTEVRAFERSFYVGSDAIEAARFFRWDIFDRTGGFDEDLTGPEDWDLSESARSLAPVARTSAMILHDEGTIRYLDACRKKTYYAEGLRRYVAKKGASALVQVAQRPWLSQPQKLLNLRGAGLITLKTGEMVSIMLALAKMARFTGGAGSVVRCSSLVRKGRRAWEILRATQHGTRTLARLGLGLLAPRLAGDANFQFRSGLQLAAPARQYHWWPIIEVILDDCYRLTEIASELQGGSCHVVDIGAHVGSFAVALAKALPGAEVTAFEPSGERVRYLRHNATVNDTMDRVQIVQAAVAGQAGRRLLTKTGVLSGLVGTQGETVDVVTFDDIMGRVKGRVDLLKMDCEGTEYEIVESASATALQKIDRLVLEYHPAPPGRLTSLLARLTEAGLVQRWRLDTLPGQLGLIYFARVRG
jgi:FkbM family methyltransferase